MVAVLHQNWPNMPRSERSEILGYIYMLGKRGNNAKSTQKYDESSMQNLKYSLKFTSCVIRRAGLPFLK